MTPYLTNSGFAELSTHESGDTLPFYRAEGEVLELWDQLQELKLEQALLEAQINLNSGASIRLSTNYLGLYIVSTRTVGY